MKIRGKNMNSTTQTYGCIQKLLSGTAVNEKPISDVRDVNFSVQRRWGTNRTNRE